MLTSDALDDDSTLGRNPTGAGDLDGDGYDDVMVDDTGYQSGPWYVGAVHILHGPLATSVELDAADALLVGVEPGGGVGSAISPAGDVDGDGKADIVIGAPYSHDGETARGQAYVMYGDLSGTLSVADAPVIVHGDADGDQLGSSVAGAGDLDGDGLDDVLFASENNDDGGLDAGAAWVVFGARMPI